MCLSTENTVFSSYPTPLFVTSRMTELNEFECNVALRPQRPYGLFHFGTSREPRTATSTFTQVLSSEIFHAFVLCCFTSTETVRTVRDQDGHLDFHTAAELCVRSVLLYVYRDCI